MIRGGEGYFVSLHIVTESCDLGDRKRSEFLQVEIVETVNDLFRKNLKESDPRDVFYIVSDLQVLMANFPQSNPANTT